MTLDLRIGSLFSGIGGLELGLERAGVGRVVWQCEVDSFCRGVLARHWPGVERFEDVQDVCGGDESACETAAGRGGLDEAGGGLVDGHGGLREWRQPRRRGLEGRCRACGRRILPACDVVAGGFPCQNVSLAGDGEGLDGDKSGLWSEFERLLRVLRPRYIVVENVAALLVRGLDRVLADLAALGFDAEWSVVSACAVGAPHTRERVFVLAYPCGAGCGQLDVPAVTSGPGHDPRAPGGSWVGGAAPEPTLLRMDDGIPVGLVRGAVRACGNAVVPQVAEVVGRRLIQIHTALERRAA